MPSILDNLNPEQRKAVTHGQGPLLIIAGAGTGKTTVITRRIAYLITGKIARPGEILALTFTDKAADEMEGRVDVLVPYGYTDAFISTFHAFGDRVLRDHALDLRLRPDYRVMSQAEQQVFFQTHLFEFPLKHYRSLGDPGKHIEALINAVSRAKDEDISEDKYLAWAKKKKDREKHLEVARVYKKYQELKARHGLVDFGDQVSLVLRLFRSHPEILRKYKERFRYILVDEFQDTNYAQFQLLKLLAGKTGNIMVVGDDDQSIYKFRGAAVSNILNFEKDYPKARKIVLFRNYRSTQIILDTAYRLIQHNNPDRLEFRAKINKKLKAAAKEEEKKVIHKHFDSVYGEADWIAGQIKEKFKEEGRNLRDFAILVRANREADPFIKALNMEGLPCVFSGGGGLYSYPEVKLCISFLRVIGNLADSISLYDLASSELYKLSPLDLQKLNTFASRRNYTLHRVFAHLSDGIPEYGVLEDLKPQSRAAIKKIMGDILYYLEFAKEHTTLEVLHEFLKKSGQLKKLTQIQSLKNENQIRNIARFFEKVREFREVSELDRVAEFVKYLNILKEAGDDPESAVLDEEAEAVNVLTVHKAKGLEFPVVFMVSLVAEKFPVRRRTDAIELPADLISEFLPAGDFHLQEERRLFYVGMTRAKQDLFFTSALDYGGKRLRKVSPFVLEALDLPRADLLVIRKTPREQIELFGRQNQLIFPEEKKFAKEELIPLSFYQVNDYLTCPLKYRYVHILKIPLLPHHTIIYGAALHKAVQAYHIARKNGSRFTQKDLVDVFMDHWSSEGFISREHEEQRLASGKEALKRFYRGQQRLKIIPRFVEEPFKIVRDNIQLKGRWDRVDEVKGKIHIIDFKSSEVRTAKEAEEKVRENLQLGLYALAWKEMYGELPHMVELHFLETGLTSAVHKTEKDIEKVWQKIQRVAEGLKKGNYQAVPSAVVCGYCPYNEVCKESAV